MRSLLKWSSILLVLLVLFVGAAYFLARHFEEPVKQYFVKQLNNRLQSPVHVENMEFSLLAKFPSASLVLNNVWAEENVITIGQADTLAAFERLYLNFNVFDLINGNYRLRGVEASSGQLNFRIDEEGRENFKIWKTTDDTTGFFLELDNVVLDGVQLEYVNRLRQQDYSIFVGDLAFNGRFSDEQYTMRVDGNGRVDHFIAKGQNYLYERDIAVETDLDVLAQTAEYAFRNGEVLIDDQLSFSLEGKYADETLDLKLEGHKLDIVKTLSLIPSEDRKLLNDFESEGILNFNCVIKGAFDKVENPYFQASFSFEDAVIEQKGSGIRLSDLKGSGSIDNGSKKRMQTAKLSIDTLSGSLGDGRFETRFSLIDFSKPKLKGQLSFSSELEELKQLLKLDHLEEASGQIQVKANIETVLQQLDSLRSSDFINANASGTVNLQNVRLRLKEDVRLYEVDSGSATIQNNNLKITACSGRINGSDLELKGVAKGFLAYVFSETGQLAIKCDVKTGDIRLEDFFSQRANSDDDRAVISFPDRMTVDANIIANSFRYGQFEAQEVSGRLLMDGFKVQADRLHFLSQEGQVQGKAGIYRFAENQFGFRSEFDLRDINTSMLFETFSNFGQQMLRSEHISGTTSATVNVQAFCDSLFQINTKSVAASVKLQITQGRLTNFEPLMDVASHINDKRMFRLFIDVDELKKRLSDVAFDTLENEITILNQTVSIPKMSIRSSAIDMDAEGTHTFNNDIDYSLAFALSEFLTLKDRKEPYNEFVRRDAKGRTRIFMRITGNTDDPQISVERTNVSSVIREDIVAERETVKSLLKDEFGAFSSDTTVRAFEVEEKEELQLEFNPETDTEREEQPAKEATAPPKKEAAEPKTIFDKLIKKTEADKKKLREGDFEDDDF